MLHNNRHPQSCYATNNVTNMTNQKQYLAYAYDHEGEVQL